MTKSSSDWLDAYAPTLADFEVMAAEAWSRVPEEFRNLCGDVLIRIDEFPADEVLDALGIQDPFDLMGLYQGISLAEKSVGDIPRGPDMVFLYRRPILDVWAEGEDPLGHIIAHVLIHEIGHHFGLSDADMEGIEAQVSGPPGGATSSDRT